eukprot:6195729-Pleurochrysis_carterae.AAC.2
MRAFTRASRATAKRSASHARLHESRPQEFVKMQRDEAGDEVSAVGFGRRQRALPQPEPTAPHHKEGKPRQLSGVTKQPMRSRSTDDSSGTRRAPRRARGFERTPEPCLKPSVDSGQRGSSIARKQKRARYVNTSHTLHSGAGCHRIQVPGAGTSSSRPYPRMDAIDRRPPRTSPRDRRSHQQPSGLRQRNIPVEKYVGANASHVLGGHMAVTDVASSNRPPLPTHAWRTWDLANEIRCLLLASRNAMPRRLIRVQPTCDRSPRNRRCHPHSWRHITFDDL